MRKLLVPVFVLILGGCASLQGTIDQAHQKGCIEGSEATKSAVREYASQQGLYVKCVQQGHAWNEYNLSGPGL